MAIINLLEKSRLSNDLILEKVKQIQIKRKELESCKNDLKEDETQKLSFMIREIMVEIDNLKIEDVKEEKRDERFKENKKELIDSLKQEFEGMNVEIAFS